MGHGCWDGEGWYKNNLRWNLEANTRAAEMGIPEAIRWFEKAAEQNNPDALFNLGFLYYSGKGIKRDWKKARGLRERAVEADKDGWSNWAGDKARKSLREMDENG